MGKRYTFLKKQDTLISPIFINVRKYTNFFTLHFVIFYNILKLKILSFIFFFSNPSNTFELHTTI